jgi:FtsZ-interacting cell division protein ZipA
MNRPPKPFDAVAMMRAARDRISAAIHGMTLKEDFQWLTSQEIEDPYLKRLRDRAERDRAGPDSSSPGG